MDPWNPCSPWLVSSVQSAAGNGSKPPVGVWAEPEPPKPQPQASASDRAPGGVTTQAHAPMGYSASLADAIPCYDRRSAKAGFRPVAGPVARRLMPEQQDIPWMRVLTEDGCEGT